MNERVSRYNFYARLKSVSEDTSFHILYLSDLLEHLKQLGDTRKNCRPSIALAALILRVTILKKSASQLNGTALFWMNNHKEDSARFLIPISYTFRFHLLRRKISWHLEWYGQINRSTISKKQIKFRLKSFLN
ncbi:MAG: hypothetical protein ACJAVY_001933 [Marinoscillum sp.]|jgi:hypothetical protein